jgi:PAS domain S-box-containing protein
MDALTKFMNMDSLPPNPEVLGRILRLQSAVHATRDEQGLAEIVVHGLGGMPGVTGCLVCHAGRISAATSGLTLPEVCRAALEAGQPLDHCPIRCPLRSGQMGWCQTLQTSQRVYGVLFLQVADESAFQPYEPFVANTGNLVALQIENQRQALEFQALNRNLENQIAARTASLQESEERFRQAMEAASDGLWDWDITTNNGYFSPAYYRMLGYEPNEFPMTSQQWAEFIHPDDRERTIAINQECIENQRQSFEVEYRLKAKDGSWKWILGRGRASRRDAQGRALRMSGTHVDITQRKQVAMALQESEEKFRLTFSASPDAININRLEDGLYVDINDGFTTLTGFSREEVIGKTSLEVNIWHDPADRQKLVRVLREKDFYNNLEAVFQRKDGSLATALMSARIFSLRGVAHIISITREISERKKTEEALRWAEEKYRSIFENALEGIYQTTPEGSFLAANPVMARILGYASPEELIRERTDVGRQGYVNPRDREEFKRRIEAHGNVTGFEYEAWRKDGRKVWVSENARVVRDQAVTCCIMRGSWRTSPSASGRRWRCGKARSVFGRWWRPLPKPFSSRPTAALPTSTPPPCGSSAPPAPTNCSASRSWTASIPTSVPRWANASGF